MGKLKKLFQAGSLLFLAGMVILLLGIKNCQHDSPDDIGIKPISAALDIPFREYEINADSLSQIETETGTMLTFQPQILVHKNGGALAHGKAIVRIREFHDAIDIMRAGIPMQLRSDRNKFLQSSGMMEIRAYQGTDELELKQGQSINTELAAYGSSKDHQLFFLKDDNSWETRDTFITKTNERKQSLLALLAGKLKKRKKQNQYDDIVFQLYGDESEAPVLGAWRGQNWKIEKRNVNQEVLESMRINWDSVKVVKVDEVKLSYKLIFWKTMHQTGDKPDLTNQFSVPVKPTKENATDLELLSDINSRFLKEDTIHREVVEEMARVNRQADLVNAFKINQMGIWNVDKAAKLSDFTSVKASFDFQSSLKDFQNVRLYCVMKEDNSVIEIYHWQKEKIYLSVKRPMEIVAILPGQKVAIVNFTQIKQGLRDNPESVFFPTVKNELTDYISMTKSL